MLVSPARCFAPSREPGPEYLAFVSVAGSMGSCEYGAACCRRNLFNRDNAGGTVLPREGRKGTRLKQQPALDGNRAWLASRFSVARLARSTGPAPTDTWSGCGLQTAPRGLSLTVPFFAEQGVAGIRSATTLDVHRGSGHG